MAQSRHSHCIRWVGLAFLIALSALGCGGDSANTDTHSDTDTGGDTVTGGPAIAFTSPNAGQVFLERGVVAFVVETSHPTVAPTALEVTFTSTRVPDALGTARPNAAGLATFETSALPGGSHTITATVVDADGRRASANLDIKVDSPPSTPVIALDPEAPSDEDDIDVVIVQASVDPEGDPITYRYRWLKNGAETGLQNATLPAAATTRGETWKVFVTPNDGLMDGLPTSAEVNIGNTAPSCDAALVLPTGGTTLLPLTCSCSGRSDPDQGDPVVDLCTFEDEDGQVLGEAGPCTLDPAFTERGMRITCTLTPSDGFAQGTPVSSSSVDIFNTPPQPPTVGLAPATADATTPLTCSVLTAGSDADLDPLTYSFEWLIGTAVVPGLNLTTLEPRLLSIDGQTARRGDSVRCQVWSDDGSARSAGAGQSPAVVLGNSAPQSGAVRVRTQSGQPASVAETLVCGAEGVDADGDALTAVVTWEVSGDVVEGVTGQTLSSLYFERGDVVTCTLSFTDGIDSSPPEDAKNSLTIENSPPSITSATLTPTEATRAEIFTCAYQGWFDADGDAPEVAFAWVEATTGIDVPIVGATSATLSAASLDAGDRIACIVTPKNGATLGAPVRSNTAQIDNTPPTLAQVLIAPNPAYADSTLTCTAQGYADPDGQPPSYAWAWTRNGTPVGTTTSTLSGPFTKGDRYRCFATPSDGIDDGPQVGSSELTIQNSRPVIVSAAVAPANGGTCASFRCDATGATDPDLTDVVGFVTTWIVNGAPVGPSLAGLSLVAGDSIACRLLPTDGTLEGGQPVYGNPVTSATTTVTNTPPSLASVVLTPADAGVGDLLRCTPLGYTDDCTTTPSWTLEWYVEGLPVPGATGPTLQTSDLRMGDEITCRATPRDPQSAGTAVSSPTLVLGPGDATPPVVAIEAPGGADGDVTCRIIEPEQWFTNPSYTYYWRLNDGEEFVGAATLVRDEVEVRHCDLVSCRVVVSDAAAELSSAVASAQMALGSDCDDGNDCTSALCDPAGGCGEGVQESGIPCTSADPCEQGECLSGVCQGLVDLCVEEPIALNGGNAWPGAFDLGGYGVVWNGHFRLTNAQESRLNETTRIDATATTFTTEPTRLPDGSMVVLSEVGTPAVLGQFGNATSSSRLDGRLISALGELSAVAFTAPNITHSVGASANSWYSTLDRTAYPLSVLGSPAVVTAVRRGSKMDNQNFSYTYSDIFFVPTVGPLAGQHISFAPNANFGAGPRFHAAEAPPGSGIVLVTWNPPNDPSRIWWWVKRYDNNSLLNVKTLILETPSSATVTNIRTAGRPDGSWVITWTSQQDGQTDVFAARVASDGTANGTNTIHPPYRINPVTAGNQVLGGIGGFSDNGFVVVWDDAQVDGLNNSGVVAQLFNTQGMPESPPIRVNTFTTGAQAKSQVAVLDDDEWVVTWQDASLGMTMTRRFYRDGAPAPGPRDVLVSSTTLGDQGEPTGARSLGISETTLVAWSSPIFLDEGHEISYRILGKDGRPISQELLANTVTTGEQKNPVAAGSTDRFLLVWESDGEGDHMMLMGRYLDLQGNVLGEPFAIDPTGTADQNDAEVAARPATQGGGFVVTWAEGDESDTEVKARRFLADGSPAGPALQANATTTGMQKAPSVTVLASGVAVIGWQSYNQVAGGGYDLYMRTLTAGAQADTLGSERRINTTTTGDQTALALLASPTGYLAACWQTPDAGGSTDVLCQTFATSNFAVRTAEFPLAVLTAGAQTHVTLALDATGSLLAAWESEGVDIAGRAILVRRLSVQGPATGVRVLAHRYAGGDQTEPWLAPLASGPYWVGWKSSAQDGNGTGVFARLIEPY